ncbi:hypothetical protein DACRYDRAFT_77691 [Dacryopinax primogenitus]|uniref:Yeast cell wall synthesis Kre9/Knh1-like N-terminal domain-containing protein n=1 Tax=Dacryopinax primogenitus (strain DJM 731) TaxID=1858805 RepID=M5G0W0_DACPD|nr:uncharacterized protein DACRYDRAFT_77691 [Dacryopinax primogenitus]EJU03886.1 hypothetical protein DACRYDRAFT_77691 [Dacryopinax primogenitus]
MVMLLLSSLLLALPTLGMIAPTTPDNSGVYPAGANCPIAWKTDDSGLWNSFEIQLMTGSNSPMTPLEIVATGLDGTTATGITSFSYPCPQVDVNAAIYFYQFTQPGQSNITWTTRFTIASSSGATVPAPNQPDNITPAPWGVGKLTGASAANVTPGGINGAAGDAPTTNTANGAGAAATSAPTAGTGNGSGAGGAQLTTAAGDGTVPGAQQSSQTSSGTFVPFSPSQSASPSALAKSGALRSTRLGWSDVLAVASAVWLGVWVM